MQKRYLKRADRARELKTDAAMATAEMLEMEQERKKLDEEWGEFWREYERHFTRAETLESFDPWDRKTS